MKSKYIFLYILLFLSFSNVSAQIFLSLDDFSQRMRRNDKPKIITEETKNIEGNAFAQDEFIAGRIVKFDGVSYIDIPMKYNIYNDQLEFEDNEGIPFYIGNPKEFKEILIGKQRYVYRDYIYKNKSISGIYELLSEGTISLVKKERILVEDSEPDQHFKLAKRARFEHLPSEYFVVKDRMYISRINSIKGMVKLLGGNKLLTQYSRLNKLKFTNESDLKKLILYYNSESIQSDQLSD